MHPTANPHPRASNRRGHHRTRTRSRVLGYTAAVLLVAAAASALGFAAWRQTQAQKRGESSAIPGSIGHNLETVHIDSTSEPDLSTDGRPIYRYSVVPGGVYSVAEFTSAVARDPLVAAHYRSVNVKALHVEKLAAAKSMYVSYRKDGQIFWTTHRVQLRAGETVLTDGRTMIRGRCGNCVSPEAQDAVADNEPSPRELDQIDTPSGPKIAAIPPVAMELLPSRGLPAFAQMPVGGAEAPGGLLIGGPLLALPPGLWDEGRPPANEPAGSLLIPPDLPILPVGPAGPGVPDTPGTPTPGSPTTPGGTIPGSPTPGFPTVPPGIVPPGGGGPDVPPLPPGDVNPVPVPEPGTWVLIGTGLVGMVSRRLCSRSWRG